MQVDLTNIEEYINNIASAPEEMVQDAYRWWDSVGAGIDPAYKHFVIMAAYLEEVYQQLLELGDKNETV